MQSIFGVNFKCINFDTYAKQNISFGARKIPRDEFVRASSPANAQDIDEKKFQAKFKNLGMNKKELAVFLDEYARGVERYIQNTLDTLGELMTPDVVELMEAINENLKADKFYSAVFPVTDMEKYCKTVLEKMTSPVKSVNEFANWYCDNSYKQYRDTQIKLFNEFRKNAPAGFKGDVSKKVEEYIDLIKTYNEIGSADEILNEFVFSQSALEMCQILTFASEEDYKKLTDILFPNVTEMSGNKVALCLYIQTLTNNKVSIPHAQGVMQALSASNFDNFFNSYQDLKVEKSEMPEMESLKKLTRTSDEEMASLVDLVGKEKKEEVLQKVLQLKLYLGKIAEFYEKQINLADLWEVYQFGILENDEDKICEALSKILKDEKSATIHKIARHLLEKQDVIFENSTIERKYFGELQAPNIKTKQMKPSARISFADKVDLISTGFFAQKIIDFIKKENITLNQSSKTAKFICENSNYSSLTNLEHHQICEELAEEYRRNPDFASEIDFFFADKQIKQEVQEILAYVEYLSEVISDYFENLRKKDIDKKFYDEVDNFFDDDYKQIGFDYMREKIKDIVQKETQKRPRISFTKHAILRLIGRDLIQPKNFVGENLDFYSFLTKIYYNAVKNKSNDFVITDLNGYSGLCVKTRTTQDEIKIITLY